MFAQRFLGTGEGIGADADGTTERKILAPTILKCAQL
jgi:hypothetical protein